MLFLLLGTLGSALAEQTIHGNYRTSNTFYYGKTYPIEILRGIQPTSFYLAFSEDSLATWTKTSGTFVWGNEWKVTSWTPTSVTEKGYLGVFTGANGTFSSTPYDTTSILSVKVGEVSSMTLSRALVNVQDYITLKWASKTVTLPDSIKLQSMESGTWTDIKVLSSKATSTTFYNTSKSITDLRLTYLDGKYTLAQSSVTYIQPEAEFTTIFNRDFNYGTTVKASGTYSSYTPIKFFILLDTLKEIQGTYSNGTFTVEVSVPKLLSSKIYTVFVTTNESQVLDTISIEFKNKFLNLSPVKSEYLTNEAVNIEWFYSKDVFTNKITFEKLVDTTWVKITDWAVANEKLTFYFGPTKKTQLRATVSDSFDTIVTYTTTFKVTEGCKEDSLRSVVGILNGLVAKKDSTIKLQKTIIDSLTVLVSASSTITGKDTTVIVILKNATGVEEKILVDNIKNINYASSDASNLYISVGGLESIYIYNLKGNVVYQDFSPEPLPITRIDISTYASGVYILVYFKENKSYIYKFVK